jgi:hypothetical protein
MYRGRGRGRDRDGRQFAPDTLAIIMESKEFLGKKLFSPSSAILFSTYARR